jgi:predicted peptidase
MANKYVKIFLEILAASTITFGCGKTEETTQTVVDTVVHTVEYEEEATTESMNEETISDETINENNSNPILIGNVTVGTDEYRGFVIDNVLHSDDLGDIHYNVYIPNTYDGTKPYALYFTLPGYEGLYFQGVAQNLKSEDFGFEAQKYNDEMIIVAPQLEDWGETSANKTIELVEYFIGTYNIDTEKAYANGFSGGEETMSIVMGKRPELFTAYLQVSSKWDGEYEPVVKNRTPVYLAIGENDEYYSSNPTKEAYNTLYNLYKEEGLTDEEIDEILVLDVKDHEYFTERGMSNEHGGGGLFAYDENIMGWLFTR